jgi:hypothetical protein
MRFEPVDGSIQHCCDQADDEVVKTENEQATAPTATTILVAKLRTEEDGVTQQ